MIKTVIFDVGNVLMKFNWWPYLCSMFGEEQAHHVHAAIWKNDCWDELNRGARSEEELIHLMEISTPELKTEIHQALDHVDECMVKLDYAIPWIKQLKEMGYQVVFLSNYSELLKRAKPEVLDFLPYMDGGVFSCDVKWIKPEPEIYQTLCELCHLTPEECLFVDDNLANIEMAKKLGFHAIAFQGYENSYPIVMETLKNA